MTAHAPDTEPPKVPLVNKPWGLWKTFTVARRNLLELIPQIAVHQPIVSGRTGIRWHMVMDPDALKIVLKDRLENYPKSNTTKSLLRPGIGDSLFIAEGAHWRWQRRAAAPVFQYRNIANLAPIMSMAATQLCERLEMSPDRQADIYQEMIQTTFDVISGVTFSDAEALDSDHVHHAINAYIDQIARISFFDMLGLPAWIPRPSRMFGRKSLEQMKRVADDTINARRLTGQKPVADLLDLLLAGEDPETRRKMNTAELRDNLLTFIVAGHETTALTLAWSLYLCAFDQTVQDRLRIEAQQVLRGRAACADDVESLPFTGQVIKEALRLYPPAAFLSRTAQGKDHLCGREIRPGDTVILPIYALHRHHLLWKDPDRFDPDRFAQDQKINRYAYLPFGAGPRVCIGAHFAEMEAQIILASLISRFRFSLIPGNNPKPVMVLTLRPEGGVRLKVTPV